MKTLTLIFFLLLSCLLSQAQYLKYATSIQLNGNSEMEVWINCEDRLCTYALHGMALPSSQAAANFTSMYEGNILSTAHARLKNADNYSLMWTGQFYVSRKNGKSHTGAKEAIHTSLANIWINEPAALDYIYAETLGEYISIEEIGKGQYKLLFPQNEEMLLTYQNGICQEISIKTATYTQNWWLEIYNPPLSGGM